MPQGQMGNTSQTNQTTGQGPSSPSNSSSNSSGAQTGGFPGGTGAAPAPTYMPNPFGTMCHGIGAAFASAVSAGKQVTSASSHGAYQLLDIVVDSINGPPPAGMRYNTFRHEGTPNPVIYSSNVPTSGAGWNTSNLKESLEKAAGRPLPNAEKFRDKTNADFFNELGTLPSSVLEARRKQLQAIRTDVHEIQQKLQRVESSSAEANELRKELERIQFFPALGNATAQEIAQEYVLAGMPKGAIIEAVAIAMKYGQFIAVRPTGAAAHMGIESGAPTKAQEFKNKTSKAMDAILCNEIGFADIGAVVHYDPRVGWYSSVQRWEYFPAKPDRNSTEYAAWQQQLDAEWAKKRAEIESRMNELRRTPNGQKELDKLGYPKNEGDWAKLKSWFESRLVEFTEEDPQYKPGGHYADAVHLNGPFIELAKRPGEQMYGDHDLFGFGSVTGNNYQFIHDSNTTGLQMQHDLQYANVFQAQHGGIWNWNPDTDFNKNIKNVIMGAHSPPDGEPLLVFGPDGSVQPMFYIAPDKLESAWEHPEATKWMEGTDTVKALRKKQQ